MRVTVGPRIIAFVSGVHRCASIWSCVLCAPVIRQFRAGEIDRGVGNALGSGWSGLFVTATGPHHRGDELRPLFDLTAGFIRQTLRGAKADELRRRLGYVGAIRSLEITWSDANGWHPHVHSVVLFDRILSPDEVAEFRAFVFRRWQMVLSRHGFGKLHPVHGVDVRPVYDSEGLSEYVAKVEGGWGVGLELARLDLKSGVTPVRLLADWSENGDLLARQLWKEYERATFGRRAIQWSPGLRKRLLGDLQERSDLEVAVSENEDEVWVQVVIDGNEWNGWVRAGRVGEVLSRIEGMAAVCMFLAGWLTGVPRPVNHWEREMQHA